MAVHQYIGAKYVPSFADPIEWDNTRNYENLVMVQYNGDTYISKIPVPRGINIDNADYWVLFSNYSAQYQQLQTQLDNLETYTRDLLPYVSGVFNVVEYGADPTGASYSDTQIATCASAASGNGYIYFPAGTYKLAAPIDLSSTSVLKVVGDGAVLKADTSMQFILRMPNGTADYAGTVSGFVFDCAGVAETGLVFQDYYSVEGCRFVNFTDFGARLNGTSIQTNNGNNLKMTDCMFSADPSATDHAIAVLSRSNSMFDGIKIRGCKIGITTNGTDHIFDNIQIIGNSEQFETVGLQASTNSHTCKIANCYFLSVNVPCDKISGQFSNCVFEYNGNTYNSLPYMILRSTYNNVDHYTAQFSGCSFKQSNSFDMSAFTPFSDLKQRVSLENCDLQGIPSGNQLYSLESTDVIGAKRTGAVSTQGTWYRFATLQQVTGFSGLPIVKFDVMARISDTIATVCYGWNRNSLTVIPFDTNNSLLDLARFAVKQDSTNGKTEFFVTPKTSTNVGALHLGNVAVSDNSGAFYLDFAETTLTDVDMDVIV